MDYVDEQENELEALSEIYYNEITVISKKSPISFSIKVSPQVSDYEQPETTNSEGEEEDSEEEEEDVDEEPFEDSDNRQQNLSVELLFILPPNYPDVQPSIEILDSRNLEEFELNELQDNLKKQAQELLGTVMVFMLVSDVIEWLSTKSDREANELETENERRKKEVEAEETKKIVGTAVTVDSFLAWKARFDAEMLKLSMEQKKHQVESSSGGSNRLTGREMFESDKTLAESDLNFVEDLDQNQIEALLHNIEEIELEEDEDLELELDDEDDFDDEDEEESDD